MTDTRHSEEKIIAIFGIFEKGEMVVVFLIQFRHKSRIVVVEALAELFELGDADLFIPSGAQCTQRCWNSAESF
jgi:hypothetical protein